MADRPAVTVVVRSFADPIKQLVTALKEDEAVPVDLPKDETDARALLEQVASAMSARHGRLLIAIDQFEECLILQDDQTKVKLALLFKDLQENPIEDLQLLFVLRTDYLKFDELTALGLPDPRPRENWFNLEALSHADARKILRQTLPDLSETLENEVIKEASVVDDLPGLIRPITLNMMGLVLKRFAGSALTETTPGKLIQDFLKKVMAKPGIEQVAPDLLAEMITEQGTKKPSAEAELAAATENAPALVRKTLYLLGEEGVVRELDRSQNIWEISHDFVARQLGQIIPRLKPSRWQRVQLAATPVALASWLVILGAGYPIYQILKEQIAYNALQAESVTILGKHGTYKILFDSLTEHGAINRVLDHAAELHPASLEINSDQAGTRLPSLDKLTSLTSLTINDNNQLAAIPSLDKLTSLTSLTINDNNQLAAIPSLDKLTSLTSLTINDNNQLAAIPSLDKLTALTSLTINGNNQLAAIPSLDKLTSLTSLTINRNSQLAAIPSLDKLTSLTSLDIYSNSQLAAIPSLDKLTSLTSLTINGNNQLAAIPSLDKLTSLTSLDIYSNDQLAAIPSLEACTNLNNVQIWGNAKLIALPALGDPSRFEVFAFDAGDNIEASIAALNKYRRHSS